MTNYHQNALKFLTLYKEGDIWMFDDEFLGIKREVFVPSASDVITELVRKRFTCDRTKNVQIIIGEKVELPDAEIHHVPEQPDNTYEYKGKELWLCPVLLRFFNTPPKTIQVKFVA